MFDLFLAEMGGRAEGQDFVVIIILDFLFPVEVSPGERERRVMRGLGHDSLHLGEFKNAEQGKLCSKVGKTKR